MRRLSVSHLEMIALLQSKSREGFTLLYDNYSDAIFAVISQIIPDTHVAEDILQETFIKVWRKADRYDAGKGSLFTWMIKIAKRTCFDYLNSKHKMCNKRGVVIEIADHENHCSCYDPAESPINAELRFFVQKIDEKYRKVIEFTYFLGYTQEETSIALGIPLGTVKTRSRDGLKKLRTLYC